ncbi:MAG: hypothetical protein KTR24_15285 [Saprospiraceae bacterium]|nr:hypothetical protein [Saprospiraceae bacterium]
MRINYFGILFASMILSVGLLSAGHFLELTFSDQKVAPPPKIKVLSSKPIDDTVKWAQMVHPLTYEYIGETVVRITDSHGQQIKMKSSDLPLRDCPQQMHRCTTTCVERTL